MIRIENQFYKDESGRTLLLRGVNLGGSSKVPCIPDGATWKTESLLDHRNVSFVGRPFPLAEANEHFKRLKDWGFTFLRFLVTWEAIEHAGPRIYDDEYCDYVREILYRAADQGITVFIDPHQDAWSRFTGGDGAPGWTLEAAGFDISRIHSAGAAFTHQENGDPFPRMIWPTNCNKLAAATMFTLFFAGNDFAPKTLVDGIPIQEHLQGHYINAIQHLAKKLQDLPNIAGYDTLNEPSSGYIGVPDISQRLDAPPLLLGTSLSIFEGMAAGAGFPQTVAVFKLGLTGFLQTGSTILNGGRQRAWHTGRSDIWQEHGVWGLDRSGQPVILKQDYFNKVREQPIHFYRDYFKPFARKFTAVIRAVSPKAAIFLEAAPAAGGLDWGPTDPSNVAHAAHWYDGMTLIRKCFISWITIDQLSGRLALGKNAVQKCFRNQIALTTRHSIEKMGNIPTFIGETGIPFYLEDKKAYRTGDFTTQENAMDATLKALDDNHASYTLWNYTSDNSNTHGDQRNGEDLSIFSRDQYRGDGSPYDGGRAMRAVVRPYPQKTADTPILLFFDMKSSVFEYAFDHADDVHEPTEIFVPLLHYPRGCQVMVSDGNFILAQEKQCLYYFHGTNQQRHTLTIKPAWLYA